MQKQERGVLIFSSDGFSFEIIAFICVCVCVCVYKHADLCFKEAITGDVGSIPEWGRSPGEGYGNPLQYSCLENPTDREVWQAIVQRVANRHKKSN